MSDNGRGKFFNYASNPISMLGFVIAGVSALVLVAFAAIDMMGGHLGSYSALITFGILPMVFIGALILVPIGMWLRHNKLQKEHVSPEEQALWPRIDFNEAHIRNVTMVFLGLTFFVAVIFATSSYLGYEFMESPRFCGTVCHTVMSPEYTAYQGSPHSRVACVQCHIGPGASWFVKAKISGMRQLWAVAVNSYHRPIHTPVDNLRPARGTCESCHWPSKHHGDKLHSFARFADDESNTPRYNAVLIKTGGGDLDSGKHGGIHWWHIYSDNKIRYVQGDNRRNSVKWVELTTSKGETRVYTRKGEAAPTRAEMEEARTMDCIDCHNRPTHMFQFPSRAMDEAIERRPDLVKLPFYKREAMKAVQGTYPTHDGGMKSVAKEIEQYYAANYPSASKELVAAGAQTASEVYGRIQFPEMKTNWETHPNHIGHPDPNTDEGFPGCWRCHDDKLTTADGKHTIPQDCDNCHTFLVEDSKTPPEFASK